MKKIFLDTNIFLRYLTNDDPVKADRVEQLLREAGNGKIVLVTTELVIAEIIWVLESYYEVNRERIAEQVRAILATDGLETINGDLVSQALGYYLSDNVDFVDGYIAAVMEKKGITEILSYDRKHLSSLKK
ncbi:MAG: type II toxin-antitoxin system VapC family toxin [Desulfobulbaceae bacterium]|nr:type II toxin-antitoxin system VapC family toxin [Desulfobulbaceae bacterium]